MDEMPIVLSNVTIKHIPGLQKFSTTVKPGSIVSIFGLHGSGKSHLLRILTSHEVPGAGFVLHAPHQSVLQVCHTPELIDYLSLLDNLRFGAPPDLGIGDRVHKVFGDVTAYPDDHWLMRQ